MTTHAPAPIDTPALVWSRAPQSTKSFALIVDDPDAPGGTFVHWVAYNIPAGETSIPAGVPQTTEIAGGGTNGINSFEHTGYNGPCPPPGKCIIIVFISSRWIRR